MSESKKDNFTQVEEVIEKEELISNPKEQEKEQEDTLDEVYGSPKGSRKAAYSENLMIKQSKDKMLDVLIKLLNIENEEKNA